MFKILYRPRLASGAVAPLYWTVKVYRWTNVVCWPLEDTAPYCIHLLDRCLWFINFILFFSYNDAEQRYLMVNIGNLDELLTGVPTILVLTEIHLRAYTLGWRKDDFKNLLKKFYAEIYIEKSTNPKLFESIKRQIWPILAFSLLYLCAINSYIFAGIYMLATNRRELIFKMVPRIDYKTHFYIYLPVLLSNVWVGSMCATMMFGDATILGQLIYHLNGRYLMMREMLNNKLNKILKSDVNGNIVKQYEQVMIETLKENMRLNQFALEIQHEYSFRIFVMLAFSAVTLCVLIFKSYTSPATSIPFIFWGIGKIQEVIAFGHMGSTIYSTTDQLSSMYYEAKWEIVIEQSSNTQHNVKLMKFIALSIMTNRKPFNFTGLNFFNVSLATVVKILQGAGSYFTFLVSLRED